MSTIDKSQHLETFNDLAKFLEAEGIPRKMYAKEAARPITMEEGKKFHFLRGGDTWKLQHYVIEIPDKVLEYKKCIAKVLEKHGGSKTAVMEAQKVYLSDYLLDLGDNCIFDKYATGCGGTTLALNDDRDCIIAVPSRELVDNKRYYRRKASVQKMVNDGSGLIKWVSEPVATIKEREDLFCIYGGLNDKLFDLEKYYQEVMSDPKRRLKIVCTYDQVGKIVDWLLGRTIGYNPNNPARPCFLYIDEMQEVYDSYQKSPDDGKDRRDAIRKMLDVINKFQHVVVISATIVAERFFFPELKDPNRFKVYHVKFPEGTTAKINLHLRECTVHNPKDVLIAELRKYLRKDNPIPSNAHVFLNSVKEIVSIIEKLGILENANKFKIVCSSKNDKNEQRIRKAIDNAIRKRYKLEDSASIENMLQAYEGLADFYNNPIGSTTELPRKINFYTARAFSGCDIYDEDAQPYIVTLDPKKTNQVFDVSTKFKQVVGRLRNSLRPPVYIYKRGGYFDIVQYDEKGQPISDIDDEQRVNKNAQDMLNSQSINRTTTDSIDEGYLNSMGLTRDKFTKLIKRDPIIAAQNAMNRRSFRDLSSDTTISAAMVRENDWNVYKEEETEDIDQPIPDNPNEITDKPKTQRMSFKNAYKEYSKIKQSIKDGVQATQTMDATIIFYEKRYPFIKDVYEMLSPEDVENAKYSPTECKRLASEKNVENCRPKILEELKRQITLDTFIKTKELNVWKKYFKNKYGLSKFKLSDYGEVKRDFVRKGKDLFGKDIRITGYKVIKWYD